MVQDLLGRRKEALCDIFRIKAPRTIEGEGSPNDFCAELFWFSVRLFQSRSPLIRCERLFLLASNAEGNYGQRPVGE